MSKISRPASGKKTARPPANGRARQGTPPDPKKAAGIPRKAPAPSRKVKKNVPSIGTKKESSLHRSLKFRYSGFDGDTETLAGNYVCDGRTREGELIEVQTGSLGPLKEKVKTLILTNKIRIVHPIPVEKIIELYNTEGRLLHRRKSPKRGKIWDLFKALVYAPELPLLKNLTIELALVDVVEKRIDDGTGSWRRNGIRIADRFLGSWHDSIILKRQKDYCRFIPFRTNEKFTARDFGEKAGITTVIARKALYVLAKMGLVKKVGKQKNAFVYERTN